MKRPRLPRDANPDPIEHAKAAALDVLRHNAHGPFAGLPRTAAWGYPEPYTRDIMIAGLGILASGDERLMDALRKTLEALAHNQSRHGHIPSLAHDPEDRGASDTTPLFLLTASIYRSVTGQTGFLDHAIDKALTWMEYQSPDDRVIVGQLPTSDWRDEQWVVGYGLFVNAIVYSYLRLYGHTRKADQLKRTMSHFTVATERKDHHIHEGFAVRHQPHLALWSYKVHRDERFDLLGNSIAILAGIDTPTRARRLITWIERQCQHLREQDELAADLSPCLFPYIMPGEPDWKPRYEKYNQPGQYHNGGIWPFISAFHVAAAVAVGRRSLAQRKLAALTHLIKMSRNPDLPYGFNEWHQAQTAAPQGQDWQTWSAAMYLYAAQCVQTNSTPYFDLIRRL